MSDLARGGVPQPNPAAYVAVRFPESYVVFHMLIDAETLGLKRADAYNELSARVQASVREALDAMGVHVVETTEEYING